MDHQYAMMVTMTPDATGHGARGTGHLDSRPALRASAPENHPGVPLIPLPAGHGAGRDTGRPDETPARDASGPDPLPVPSHTARDAGHPEARDTPKHGTPDGTPDAPSRGWIARAITRLRDAHTARVTRLRDSETAQRAARDTARHTAAETRDALMREAGRARRRPGTPGGPEGDKIAPVPMWMQKASVWGMRVVGALLPLSPLLVSGFATIQVGRDEPLKMGWVAIFFTLGLEGAVWYLAKLRELFRLEGDGTGSLGLGIYSILALIFGLLSGHAIWNSAGRQPIDISIPGTEATVPLSELVPALAIAVMSAIGTFIWAKKATYQHRAKLRAMDMIDPRPPKFSSGAWMLAPWETFRALRHFYKYRIAGSADLVTKDWRLWRASGKPKIWPIPVGFRYEGRRFIQLTADELRDTVARDTLIADLIQRDTVAAGHHAPTGHPETGRPAELTGHGSRVSGTPHQLPSGTPDAAATGHLTAGHGTPNGTPYGAPHGARHGTPRTGHSGTRDTDVARDANGTIDPATNGTPDSHGARDADGAPDGTGHLDDDDVAALKDSAYVMIIAERVGDWATSIRPPSVRRIVAEINAFRQETENGSFASKDIAGRVQRSLIRFRDNPDLFVLARQIEGTADPSA